MHRRALALAALLALLGTVLAAPALGQERTPSLTIREVDATDPDNVTVTFIYDGDRNAVTNLTVREAGTQLESSSPVPVSDEEAVGVVLLIDNSGSMEENGAIERAREAAQAYVDARRPAERVAVITFGSNVEVAQDFTTDSDRLNDAIAGINLSDGAGTLLYDGLAAAAELYQGSTLQPNVLLLGDGDDSGSSRNRDGAIAALNNVDAAVFSIALESGTFDADELQAISQRTGGRSLATSDATQLESLFAEMQETLARQYVVTFASNQQAGSGSTELRMAIGDAVAEASYSPGSLSAGDSVRPVTVAEPFGPSFLRDGMGLVVGVILVLVAVAMIVYALVNLFTTDRSTLQSTLQPYAQGYVASEETDDIDEDPRGQRMAQTQILQRAVELTGQIATDRGVLQKIESQLERANLPLRAAEALFFYLASVVVLTMLVLVLSQNVLATLIALLFFGLIPPTVLSFLANRRRKQFEGMLPDTLQLLSSTLRAGYSLMQGVEAVSQEVAEPMGRELRRVVTEARLGRPLETALEGVAERMDSNDFAWAVMAIRIQREVGGNLSELLMTVADTMTQRERLRRDVAALTAEGRISAIVLGILPLGLMAVMWLINPDYIGVLFDKTVGMFMLGGGIVMMLLGFWWMKKIIDIEI